MKLDLPKQVKFPKHLMMFIEADKALNNYRFTRVVEKWCILKSMDTNGSGVVSHIDDPDMRNALCQILNISQATWYNYLFIWQRHGLITRKGNTLHLSTWTQLKTVCGAQRSAGFTHIDYKMTKPGYLLKSVWIKEKMVQMHTAYCLKVSEQKQIHLRSQSEAVKQRRTDFMELVEAFEIGDNEIQCNANPDLGISQTRLAQAFGCEYSTSGWYWTRQLEKACLLDVERERLIKGTAKSYMNPLSSHVFYSRKSQTRIMRLPNLLQPTQPLF